MFVGLFGGLHSGNGACRKRNSRQGNFVSGIFVGLRGKYLIRERPCSGLSARTGIAIRRKRRVIFVSRKVCSSLLGPNNRALSAGGVPFLRGVMGVPFNKRATFGASLCIMDAVERHFTNSSTK